LYVRRLLELDVSVSLKLINFLHLAFPFVCPS
jgi:hypothetical protein